MNRSLPAARNAYEATLLHNLRTWGWSLTHVHGCEEEPSFAYSVGLLASYHHPEIIVVGLTEVTSHGLVSVIANRAAAGRPIDLAVPNDRIIRGYSCVFSEVSRANREKYALSACWLYGGSDFPLYQLIWPSEDGIFPWHPDATDPFRCSQPVLSDAARIA